MKTLLHIRYLMKTSITVHCIRGELVRTPRGQFPITIMALQNLLPNLHSFGQIQVIFHFFQLEILF